MIKVAPDQSCEIRAKSLHIFAPFLAKLNSRPCWRDSEVWRTKRAILHRKCEVHTCRVFPFRHRKSCDVSAMHCLRSSLAVGNFFPVFFPEKFPSAAPKFASDNRFRETFATDGQLEPGVFVCSFSKNTCRLN